MKIQCACGAKYAFDITPEMAEKPMRFVCQQCGLDSSDFVNQLIRQELGLEEPGSAPDTAAPEPPPPPVAPAPAPAAKPRLFVARATTPASPASPPATPAAQDAPLPNCLKHNEPCIEHCTVCHKPICPKCMELFGYLCSPLCKAKAEAQRIHVPVYAGQKTVVEAQFWRKAGRIFGAVAVVMAVLLGFWFWYAWFGSYPKPVFSVRFDDPAYSGASKLCGQNQIVFLHGGTLARYDLKSKKEIWSRALVDRRQLVNELAKEEADFQAEEARARGQTPGTTLPTPDDKVIQLALRGTEEELQLFAIGSNVWIGMPDKLTHYDWDSGQVLQEIPLPGGYEEITPQGDELTLRGMNEAGQEAVTSVNLASGESHTETAGRTMTPEAGSHGAALGAAALAANNNGDSAGAGLPLVPGANRNKPLDPGKVAQQAQNLPLPSRIALPALMASSMHQEQIMKETDEGDTDASSAPPSQARAGGATAATTHAEHLSLASSEYGSVQVGVRLLEERIVSRDAMKAPPKKSVLDSGNLSTANTADAANEILNQMQRDRGGNTVTENESLYQVSLSRPDSTGATDWIGQVVGPPAVYALKTVNVLAAGTTVIVFDKTNKKLWQATLAFSMQDGAANSLGGDNSRFGAGPCVERGDTLYVFDQAVLTAYDLATGNARWRVPSVGVVGLFFDDQGMLYANSTTASPESIKFARQIDINRKTEDVLIKVDPKIGKILWSIKPGGFISYLSGKYIYALYINSPTEDETHTADLAGISPPSPFVHIRRLNPRNGEIMWDYEQDRAPLDVEFSGNVIQMVFKKEVQVLKYVSL
jgi:hypothetical protein